MRGTPFHSSQGNAKIDKGSCERVERVNLVAQIGFCNATEYEQHFARDTLLKMVLKLLIVFGNIPT